MKSHFKQRALKSALISAFALGATAVGVNSYAATSTGTFGVSATVAASCTISGTSLAFGSFDVLGANVDNTSTLTATCTNGSAYVIGLNEGVGTGATVTDRKMLSGTDLLNYSLFSDSARTVNWGNGVTVVAGEVAGTGNGTGQSITVYGRIPTGQTSVPAGAYTDTITATINF